MKKTETVSINIIVVLVMLVLIGTAYYFFSQYKKTQLLLNNPTLAAKEEVKKITDQLSKLMELPAKEEPIVVTVLDKKKLTGQDFFKRAENGDKVIVYSVSKKAILFRPSINKIIEVAPLNLGDTNQPVKIALYNGTTTVGMISSLEKELTGKVTNITIADKANAKKTDYEKTLVIDLSGKKSELAKQLATLLNAQVSKLPAGETAPKNTDLLVIIGADYKTSSASPTIVK
ncbi:hypothetical protein CO165_03685 [Candidatus Roizmanbacteria bacterium CG_4_9_14_3_um_filter_33_18]|uniref:LytR/CpsA/Psr regulator C-terminal domain-containing protein n=1 Tax=Candidatus Roizmanbacteria bacterium CG_4_9_14_3_um_filter_33_18 TaxID=1974841 RepID=A0A2M7XXF1_9BACT|nr:MAG: hypothetical protein CO165_03685 [Candidatus Roizmanbacteria bacterium CG_4_9_14_3_um_filter_33_18]